MSQRGYANSIFRTVLSILLLLFLGVLIWQQDAREEKLIQLYKDHQELSSQIGRTQQKMDALTQQIRAGVRLNTSDRKSVV